MNEHIEHNNNIIEFPRRKERLLRRINNFFADGKSEKRAKIEDAVDNIFYQSKYNKKFKDSKRPDPKEYFTKEEYERFKQLMFEHDEYEKEQQEYTVEALRIFSTDPSANWRKVTHTPGHDNIVANLYEIDIDDNIRLNLNGHKSIKSGVSEFSLVLCFLDNDGQLDNERGRIFPPIYFEVDSDNNIQPSFALRLLNEATQKKIQMEIIDQVKKLKEQLG